MKNFFFCFLHFFFFFVFFFCYFKFRLVPELFYVPKDKIAEVRADRWAPGRVPNDSIPLVWAQSLMIVGDLLLDDFVTPGELDPLGRRFRSLRERRDTLIQVVLLTETEDLQRHLSILGLETQTVGEISPFRVHSSARLSQLYTLLGRNRKMGLTGRPYGPIRTLATSKVYRINGVAHLFTPHFMEVQKYYTTMDNDLVVEMFKNELEFVRKNWHLPGRPTLTIVLTSAMFSSANANALLNLLLSLRSGTCHHVSVKVGRITEMVNTSCIDEMEFLSQGVSFQDILGKPYTTTVSNVAFLKTSTAGAASRYHHRPKSRRRPGASFHHGLMHSSSDSELGLSEEKNSLKELPLTEERAQKAEVAVAAVGVLDQREEVLLHGNPEEQTTVEGWIQRLRECHDMVLQADLIDNLVTLHGLDFVIEGLGSLRELLEGLYLSSATSQYWSVTRHTTALLRKEIDNLAASVVEILVQQRQLTLGPPGCEVILTAPLSPAQLEDLIFSLYSHSDIREVALVRELLTFLELFVRAEPNLFEGILRLRISDLIATLKGEVLAHEALGSFDEASERLFHRSPSAVKQLVHQVFAFHSEFQQPDEADFSAWRATSFPAFDPARYQILGNGGKLLPPESLIPHTHTKVSIAAKSAGFMSGNDSVVELDDRVIFEMHGSGIGVVIIDPANGRVTDQAEFNTHASVDESEHLAHFIFSQKSESVVVAVVKNDASENLTPAARAALEKVGSLRIGELEYHSSWAFISAGSAEELRGPKDGPAEGVRASLEVNDTSATEFLRPSRGQWRRRRQLDGGLIRFPPDFFPQVHAVLKRTRGGIVLNGSLLAQDPTVRHMTPGERNFALSIQSWMEHCPDPLDRSLATEALVAVHTLYEHFPDAPLEALILDDVIAEATRACWAAIEPAWAGEFNKLHVLAREFFSDVPAMGKDGTLRFLRSAARMILYPKAPSSAVEITE